LTPGRGLVLERAGYDVHKTPSAIRLIPLAADDALELEKKIQKMYVHFGDRPLLLRGDGSHAAGVRDQRLANDFGFALKVSTTDPRARPHSVRAATLQEAAWPGWQERAYEFLKAEAGPMQCKDWVNKTAEFPLRLSRAVATAGQSDLRSAFGNYLAAWSIIYAIHCTGSLNDLSPEPAFLAQLGLSSSNLRTARSRHLTQSGNLVTTRPKFDTNNWIGLQAAKINAQRSMALTTRTSNNIQKPSPAVASSASPKTASIDQLTYLAVRALGLIQERALEKVVIPHSLAVQLELHLPAEDSIASAVSRARQGPESRGQAADIDMALSSAGKAALTWLCKLDHEDFLAVKTTLFKAESTSQLMLKKVAFFEKLTQSLPDVLHIRCRFGAKHLDTSEKSALALLAPAISFSTDCRLGQRPVVSISIRGKQNLVVGARLTSVVRVYTLVLEAFRLSRTGTEHAV
jgi:hypothetical protein